jgi:hypothetical protein
MRNGLLAMLALALVACGSKTEEQGAAQRAAAASAQVAGSDEVAAVLESSGTPVAKVRFVIESRPVVGRSFNVKVVVSSPTPVPQLLVKVGGADLTVEPPTVMLVLGESGGSGSENINSHTFAVTAQQEGLSELAVHLTTAPEVPETLYIIPVLVSKAGSA